MLGADVLLLLPEPEPAVGADVVDAAGLGALFGADVLLLLPEPDPEPAVVGDFLGAVGETVGARLSRLEPAPEPLLPPLFCCVMAGDRLREMLAPAAHTIIVLEKSERMIASAMRGTERMLLLFMPTRFVPPQSISLYGLGREERSSRRPTPMAEERQLLCATKLSSTPLSNS